MCDAHAFPVLHFFNARKIANVTIFRPILLPDLHPEDWGHILRLRPGNASGPRHSLPDLFNYFFNEVWVLLKCDVSCAVVCTPRENKLSNLRKSHKSASNRVVLFRSQKTVPTYQMIVRGPTITDSTVSELLSILTLRYSPILSNTDKTLIPVPQLSLQRKYSTSDKQCLQMHRWAQGGPQALESSPTHQLAQVSSSADHTTPPFSDYLLVFKIGWMTRPQCHYPAWRKER